MKKPIGYIAYEGPSLIDGKPIVAIVNALKKSGNTKTGHLVQTFILRADLDPVSALAGEDVSICGRCEHRPSLAKKLGAAPCYVNVFRAPLGVYRAYKRGSYTRAPLKAIAAALEGLQVRIGTYGDPAAVPVDVWSAITADSAGHVGYTHQWQAVGFDAKAWAPLVMASADSPDEREQARAMGMRVFRVSIGVDKRAGEATCPASAEGGKRAQCSDCMLCAGTSKRARDIVIADHSRGHAKRVIMLGAAA